MCLWQRSCLGNIAATSYHVFPCLQVRLNGPSMKRLLVPQAFVTRNHLLDDVFRANKKPSASSDCWNYASISSVLPKLSFLLGEISGSKFQSNSNLQFIIFPSAATARENPYGFQTLDEGMGVLGSKKSQPCNGRVWYLWWGATIMEAASTTLGRGKGGLPYLGSWIKSFQRPLSRCLFCVHLELSERLSIQASNAESSLHRLPSGVSRHPRGMVCLYGSTQVHIRTACCRCCDWRQGRWDDRAVEATETWQWMFWRGCWMLNILWREVRRHHPPICRHCRHEILYNMTGISQEVMDNSVSTCSVIPGCVILMKKMK